MRVRAAFLLVMDDCPARICRFKDGGVMKRCRAFVNVCVTFVLVGRWGAVKARRGAEAAMLQSVGEGMSEELYISRIYNEFPT